MELVFLIGAIQALILTSLLLTKKGKMFADKVLAFWLVFTAIMLFSYYAELTGLDKKYPAIAFFAFSYGMFYGAISFIYVYVLTQKKQQFHWHYLIHIIPYLFFTIILYFKLQSHPNPIITEAIIEIEDTNTPLMWAQTIFNIFLGPLYLVAVLFLLRKHRKSIEKNFSYTENIDLKWLNNVLLGAGIVWGVVIIMTLISNYNHYLPSRIGDNIIFSTITLLVFFMGYFGLKQQVIYSVQPIKVGENSTPDREKESESGKYKKSGLKPHESDDYLDSLLKYMEDEKPYLDGKLSLKQLASTLDISTNYLSQIINEKLQLNFFDFVNKYRVDLLKTKLKENANSNYTLLSLAYDCGFNSKSSFNATFKKHTGLTPSQYLKSN